MEQNVKIGELEKSIILEDGIYYKKVGKNRKQIVLSEEYSKILIKKIHEKFCYTGINQTESKMKPFYTAPNLSENIKQICKNCEICIKNKTEFKEGDMVYVDYGNKLNKKKMDEIRIGPFEIGKKISDSVFKINTGRGTRSIGLYHVTKLIPMLVDF